MLITSLKIPSSNTVTLEVRPSLCEFRRDTVQAIACSMLGLRDVLGIRKKQSLSPITREEEKTVFKKIHISNCKMVNDMT